jgi:DNA-binding MarR family transcriptional regulator
MSASERLGLDLKRAEQALMTAKHAALKPLTVPQYAALFALSTSPGISAAALARACLVTPQAMTVLLKGLEERGLVERTPHPWHGNVLETRLTPAGLTAFETADEKAVAIERHLSEEFTEAERALFRSLLARCVTSLGEV